jgi:hypothetical protein
MRGHFSVFQQNPPHHARVHLLGESDYVGLSLKLRLVRRNVSGALPLSIGETNRWLVVRASHSAR